MTPIFQAQIRQGKVVFDNRENFDMWVANLEGKSVEVLVRLPSADRTNQANRYYWAVIVKVLSDELGYDPNEMHEVLKYIHNPHNIKIGESEMRIGGSTRLLDTGQFSDYCERIRKWALTELNPYLPQPNEVEP